MQEDLCGPKMSGLDSSRYGGTGSLVDSTGTHNLRTETEDEKRRTSGNEGGGGMIFGGARNRIIVVSFLYFFYSRLTVDGTVSFFPFS